MISMVISIYKSSSKIIFLLLIISALFLSCPNEMMIDLIESKLSDPVTETFDINDGTPVSALSVTLNSKVVKDNDALEMRFRNENGGWSDWQPYSDTANWTLPIGDGIKTIYAEYRDEGHHVVAMQNIIELNTGAPEAAVYVWGSGITAPEKHDYINTVSVSLCIDTEELADPNVYDMCFSNTSIDGPWSSWIPYTSTVPWTMTSGDEGKTIFAQFRTNAGNIEKSSCSIILDTTPPVVSGFQINGGDASATDITASLDYSYTDACESQVQYMNDSGSWSAMEVPGASPVTKSWTLRSEIGTRTVSVRLTDIAGNVSSVYSDTINLTQNDSQAVASDTSSLVIGYAGGDSAGNVTQNLVLPAGGPGGTAISWISDNTAIITPGGTVNRPAFTSGNASVALTATITKGSASAAKIFNLTVIANPLAALTTDSIAENLAYTTDIAGISARGGGNVTDQGLSAVTERGLCWNTTGSPVRTGSHTSDGTGAGIFTGALMTGLTENTTYYVRSYAVNAQGTAYGNEITFNSGWAFDNTLRFGGYVFYNDGTGHGITASPADLSSAQIWGTIYEWVPGGTSTAIGTGDVNTTNIINQYGADHNTAAYLCRHGYSGGGFTDWFLPSRDELQLLYLKTGGFAWQKWYWSSSEYPGADPYYIYMFWNWGTPEQYEYTDNAKQNGDGSNGQWRYVRAARKF